MNTEVLHPKDIKTKQAEFQAKQSKIERAIIINTKRVFLSRQNYETTEDIKIASYYQNVYNKEEVIQLIKTISDGPPQPHLLRQFIAEMDSKDTLTRTHGIVSLRILFTKMDHYSPRDLIAYDGLSPIFAAMQDFLFPHIQAECAWTVSIISSGESENTHALVNKGIVPILQKMLKCSFESVVEHVLFTIGNISTDCQVCRNAIWNSGMIPTLLRLSEKFINLSIKNKLTWISANVLRLQPGPEANSEMAVELMKKLISDFTNVVEFEFKSDCIYGLSKHAKIKNVELFMNPQFLSKLRVFYEDLILMKNPVNISILCALHEILSGLSLCQDIHVLELMKHGFLRNLLMVLCTNKPLFMIDGLLILSNFVVGNDFQVSAILVEPGLMDKIMTLANNEDSKIQKNAIWVICNMCGTSNLENIKNMISYGMLQLFSQKLVLGEDPVTLNNIVEALGRLTEFFERTNNLKANPFVEMMNESGISMKLEKLQEHKSENVYRKVLEFMEKYFEVE